MKRAHIFNNLFSFLGFLTLAALFQNCSLQDSGSSPLSSLDYQKLTAPNCPLYTAPKCINGSTPVQIENTKGCKYTVCQKKRRITSCSKQALPLCKPHEKILKSKDSNGCFYAQCTLKTTKTDSKEKMPLLLENKRQEQTSLSCKKKHTTCEKNKILSTGVDEHRCLKNTCKTRKSFYCPLKKDSKCSQNEVTYNSFDEKGCARLVCKNRGLVACPKKLNKVKCLFNETKKISVDDKGCKQITCKKKIRFASVCRLKRPPRCALGQRLSVRTNQKGCSLPYCRSY